MSLEKPVRYRTGKGGGGGPKYTTGQAFTDATGQKILVFFRESQFLNCKFLDLVRRKSLLKTVFPLLSQAVFLMHLNSPTVELARLPPRLRTIHAPLSPVAEIGWIDIFSAEFLAKVCPHPDCGIARPKPPQCVLAPRFIFGKRIVSPPRVRPLDRCFCRSGLLWVGSVWILISSGPTASGKDDLPKKKT